MNGKYLFRRLLVLSAKQDRKWDSPEGKRSHPHILKYLEVLIWIFLESKLGRLHHQPEVLEAAKLKRKPESSTFSPVPSEVASSVR